MPWPTDSLTDDETIITTFRPHWKLLFVPAMWALAVIFVASLVEVFVDGFALIRFVIAIAVLAAVVVKPLVDWWFTRYVLTSERLMTRSGLIAQRGIEIPLERITNVNFAQTVFERLVGAGDLLVESAGETGQSSFADIPHPDRFQAVLYKSREARTISLSSSPQPPPPKEDGAEAIRKLASLRDDGLITDEEYEAKRSEILKGM
jgi:uncharacterized membrane protein YdbT with pleckstrin-like domain